MPEGPHGVVFARWELSYFVHGASIAHLLIFKGRQDEGPKHRGLRGTPWSGGGVDTMGRCVLAILAGVM